MNFNQYIKEGRSLVNSKIDHIENKLFVDGYQGAQDTIELFRSFRDMLSGHSKTSVNLIAKWDSSFSIVCGINPENEKFFVGTTSVFNKVSPKINYTFNDIDLNYSDNELNRIFKVLLNYLPSLNITGILQGELLFTEQNLKPQLIDGVRYITFQPNKITYAVPIDTELGAFIAHSKVGIIFHSSYYGQKMNELSVSHNVDFNRLTKTKNIWVKDASFVDVSGTITFTERETIQITGLINDAIQTLRQIGSVVLNRLTTNVIIKKHIKDFNNYRIKNKQPIKNVNSYVIDFLHWLEKYYNTYILDAKREQTKHKRIIEKNSIIAYLRGNYQQLLLVFELYYLFIQIKNIIINKLNKVETSVSSFIKTDSGFKITNSNGFIAVDKLTGNVVKLVDRLDVIKNNFKFKTEWR